MKINWKLRLRNKATCASLLVAIVAFVYQVLSALGITTPISEDVATNVVAIVVNIATGFGILIDPTTKGVSDSERAMGYEEPN